MPKTALSDEGRKDFGSWLADRLMVAAGGVGALILAPTLLGSGKSSAGNLLLGWLALALLAGSSVFVRLDVSERRAPLGSQGARTDD
ncbi:MAG TPA: hypothetical protein VHX64_16215 [Caulobacteraceae bacterium]|nr:hypothetical protein [Caulobacteraceae bacterium]